MSHTLFECSMLMRLSQQLIVVLLQGCGNCRTSRLFLVKKTCLLFFRFFKCFLVVVCVMWRVWPLLGDCFLNISSCLLTAGCRCIPLFAAKCFAPTPMVWLKDGAAWASHLSILATTRSLSSKGVKVHDT